tara:strand:+ start:16915 stop:18060 length:1146 start_codon:yes stop_codon:yes gene_type:complete
METKHFDLIIAGSGPAGATCAMALEKSGLRIAVIDRSNFPRDKICGDFVAAKGIRELVSVKPQLHDRLAKYPHKVINTKTHFYVNNLDPLDFNWVLKSYNIKRMDFDNELVEMMLEDQNLSFYPGQRIRKVSLKNDLVEVRTDSHYFTAKMVIGADGAQSQVAKDLARFKVHKEHYGGSVRAYFKNVENIKPEINEVYLHRNVIPGYFWLFPVSPTEANVGVGTYSNFISKHKVNLKERFYDFIETSPRLQQKLGNAQMVGKLEGFGLPLFSKKHVISGERFLLLGDAASMIDPTNGEGIMPAIVSAKLAAQQVEKAFSSQNFSAEFLKDYEKSIHQRYWTEMKMKTWVVKAFGDKHRLISLVGWACVNSGFLKRRIEKLM